MWVLDERGHGEADENEDAMPDEERSALVDPVGDPGNPD